MKNNKMRMCDKQMATSRPDSNCKFRSRCNSKYIYSLFDSLHDQTN